MYLVTSFKAFDKRSPQFATEGILLPDGTSARHIVFVVEKMAWVALQCALG